MEKLNTIQKREKLNDVYVVDEKGNGGANHEYWIEWELPRLDNSTPVTKENYKEHQLRHGRLELKFQNGARKLETSSHGVLDTDLLEIVRHRLQCFQQGEFATRENACALTHIEEALMWMNRRVEDRIEREVLGTNNK